MIHFNNFSYCIDNYLGQLIVDRAFRFNNEEELPYSYNYTYSYTYDANGNQRHRTVQAASEEAKWGNEGIGLSLLGEEIEQYGNTAAVEMYSYNGFGQMTQAVVDGTTAAYAYNPDGLRISKTVNGETTKHILDGANVVADIKGGAVSKYNRGRGLISIEQNGNKGYYTFNGHGDVTGIVDGTGTLKNESYFYAFGGEIYQESIVFDNPFGYAGEYTDTESGNIYLRARYYDPTTGRFVSEDTHWNTGNMIFGDNAGDNPVPSISAIMQSGNLYGYCSNNPVNKWDPTGNLEAEDAYVLSREDYVTVLFLTYAFDKAQAVGNTHAMDGAAEQAAKIRQKPQYHGKYSSSWNGGAYKKTYQPHAGFDGSNGGVYIDVDVMTTQMEVDMKSGAYIQDTSNALGSASGSPFLDQVVAPISGILSLFVDEEMVRRLDIGSAEINLTIYDYDKGQTLYGRYVIDSNNINIQRHEVKRHDIPVGGRQ